MRTLVQRGYVVELGHDPGPGQAVLFGTSASFLEQLGLDSLDDLPPLGDFVPSAPIVEQLEQGLRPDGPSAPERYDPTAATEAFIASGDLDDDLGVDLDLDVGPRPSTPAAERPAERGVDRPVERGAERPDGREPDRPHGREGGEP
jgi:segregation and condensation protein B